MISQLLAKIRYHINVTLFNIRFTIFNAYTDKIKHRMKRESIIWRLWRKRVERTKALAITDRYFNHQLYIQRKESKEAYHQLMEFVGEWSKSSGIPQWEARALISRDFHIDI